MKIVARITSQEFNITAGRSYEVIKENDNTWSISANDAEELARMIDRLRKNGWKPMGQMTEIQGRPTILLERESSRRYS